LDWNWIWGVLIGITEAWKVPENFWKTLMKAGYNDSQTSARPILTDIINLAPWFQTLKNGAGSKPVNISIALSDYLHSRPSTMSVLGLVFTVTV